VQLDLLSEQVQKKSQKDLTSKLTNSLDNAAPSMWSDITAIFEKEKVNASGEVSRILHEFECEGTEAHGRLEAQDVATFKALVSVLDEKVKNLDLIMLTKFKQKFELDVKGVPRQWESSDKLDVEWQKAKLEAEKLVDLFSIIRIHENLYDYHYFEPNALASGVVQVKSIPNVPDELQLISPTEGNRLLLRFRDQAATSFSAAIKDRDRSSSQGIPYYMVVLLLLLGWNEILWLIYTIIFNPLALTFTLLLLAVAYGIYVTKSWGLVKGFASPFLREAKQYVNFRISKIKEQWFAPTPTLRLPPAHSSLSSSEQSHSSLVTAQSLVNNHAEDSLRRSKGKQD